VVEVVSGDTVVVAVPRGGGAPPEERRIYLSSLRAPRLARRGEDKEQPWASEAKEVLRRTLIGRDVTVSVEYTRAPPAAGGGGAEGGGAAGGAGGDRINTYGTVTFSTRKGEDTNAAVVIVCEWRGGRGTWRCGSECVVRSALRRVMSDSTNI
jgi:hypothetical protein